MSSTGIFRRGYLSNFLAIVLAITGLQGLTVVQAPNASALSWASSTIPLTSYGPGLATSSDGTKVFAGAQKGAYLSTDSGVTWSAFSALDNLNSSGYQVSVAMSNDGTKLYYAFNNKMYYSWNSGSTWNNSNTSSNKQVWNISASYDGTKILMTTRDGGLYSYSTNSGQSWTEVTDSFGGGWAGAISGDGTKIIIAERNSKNRSTGSGIPRMGLLGGTLSPIAAGGAVTGFDAVNTSSYNDWRGAACDYTCTHIVLANAQGGLYTSSDSGATWVVGANAARGAGFKSLVFGSVSSSSDGSRLAATVSWDLGTGLYVSTDYGVNWSYESISCTECMGVAVNSLGTNVYSQSNNATPTTIGRAVFPVSSTTTLTTPSASGVYGNSDTLTATINSNTATGTVDFKNNGTSITGCSAKTVTAGVATCNPSVGTYASVTAVYSGNGSLGGSTSNAVSFSVTPATLTITASSPTVSYGASSPSISASYSGLLKGDASNVVTGQTCSTVYTTTSPAGSLPATSCSGGTASNYTIAYVSGAVIINKIAPSLSLALPSNASTATFGTAVVITATVSKPGSVTFNSGGSAISGCTSVAAASTSATCSWTPTAANSATVLTADFIPTDSTSFTSLVAAGSKTINVGKATQAVSISATAASFNLGESDTLTATIAAGATGTATFNAGGNALCTTGSLNGSGAAQCSWTPSVAGTYSVTATYSGDSNYVTGTSSASSIVVNSVITYDLNGGTGTAPSVSVSPGTSTTLPTGAGLSKSGYTFGGWSTTNSGSAVSSPYSSTTSRTLYAVWTANTYTITYNANRGSGSQSSGSYTTGAVATTLPATSTFTRTGYTFVGWATSETSTTPVTSYSTSATVTFYAIWIHGTYTVTFAANSGSGTMAVQTSNATANLNANTFTYTDRVFNGWNTSADGTGTAYSNSASYPFLASITLYAQWGNVITFSSQGALSGTPSLTSQSWSSGAINLPTVGTMVKTGYTFGGWSNGTTTFAAGSSYTPTGGITLNPVWAANTYSITFNKNLATSGNVPTSQSWTAGTAARTLSGNIGSPVLAKSGYTFGGWATSASSTTAVTTYSTASDQTFYAIWTPISYSITYALNGGTSTLPTQANQQIYNTFTLAATPTKVDYYFAGWSDSATATTYAALATYSITASSAPAITLTAQWIPTYTLNYVLNGSTSAVTGEGTYNSGTVVTLTAAPTRTGYTFNNWLDSSNVTHAALSSFTMLQNSVLQAQWTAILYPVTYALNGATGTLPLQSSLTMNSPFIVSTAPVRAGYTFDGWSDGTNVYSTGSTYVIGTSSVTLTAQWTAISYSVTYDLGGGQGTLPTQANGSIGSTFSLPATGSNPTWIAHTFTGWFDGSAVYAAGSTYTFSASNVTLTAQFSLNGYTQIAYSLGASGVGALPASTSALEGNTIVVASGTGITRANYAFAGWSDGSSVYQPGDVYLVGPEAAPITFVPSWTSGYNVSYASGNAFGIAPVDPVGRITGSTFIVASAATLSRQGFTFTGWSDGTNVVQPGATYTVASANITLTAQWVQNSLAGIPTGALTQLANFTIVNGVSPTGSFNFGSTTIAYTIPANALSAGTTVAVYGLTDTSSISGMLPGDKSVVSSTVISWLSTDGTVPDASSPIAMTITNSQIVPGTVVYAISGSSLVMLGTATTNGSITTTITSDPVIVILNAVVATPPVVTPVVTAPIVTAPVVTAPAVVAVPVVMPTITSLTFVENTTKTGGKLVWVGTNIDSVLFSGTASTYPAPFNYGAFTLSWSGELVNMVAGVTYTMKIEARSSTGGSDSKTIEYTIAKPVIDTSVADAALKAAQEKAAAEKKAAEEAAALKIAQEKALAEAKAAADAAALKVAQDKAAADAKAAEEAAALKIAQEKAAAEAKAAEEAAALKIAQDKAAADAAVLALAKKTPILNLFTWYASGIYSTSQNAKMKKLTLKLEPATTLKCVGYINTMGTTSAKAKAIALVQAKTTCANAKKLNPSITTVVTTAALTKAPKPLVGASNTKAKYRVDLLAYKG